MLKIGASVTPHKRGHSLEALLREVIQADGWLYETNVRARGEEHDLVIFADRESYLAECKWEAQATEAGQIRDLRDKVSARPGVRGLFFQCLDTPQERQN